MHALLLDIGFLRVALVDVLDILMVAAIIYFLFRWIKGSAAMNIALAIIALLFLRILVDALKMRMMSSLLGTVIDVGAIALIVIFQPEIRHFLYNLGRSTFSGEGNSWLGKLFRRREAILGADMADEVVEACFDMAEQKEGALIVFTSADPLEDIVATGDKLDATISKPLIENVFFKNSPLHDGAMVIRGSRIVAARCTLPITDRTDIPARYGMRHKAAIGITEKTDTKVIVVSEQTGDVSFVADGKLEKIKSKTTLKLKLADDGQKTGSEAGV